MNHSRVQAIFFTLLFLGAVALAFFILQPYIAPLFLAFVLYILWKPVHKKVAVLFGGYRSIAAFVSLLMILLVVMVPLVLLGISLSADATRLYEWWVNVGIHAAGEGSFIQPMGGPLGSLLQTFEFDVASLVGNIAQSVAANASSIVSGIFNFGLGTFVMLVALFYLLRDGDVLRETIMNVSPLPNTYDADIYDKVEHAVGSVVKGSLLIAVAQGLMAGIGFVLFGIPNPILWGTVTAVTSIIPNIGAAVVFVPMVIYLYVQGSLLTAIAVAIWGLIAVGLIDNFLRLFVVKTGVPIHPFIILLSVIGGVGLFGGVGIIAGPVVMSFVYAIFHLYPQFVRGGN